MICEETVKKIPGKEFEPKLPFPLRSNVSAKKKALNRVKRLDLETDQVYRAKLLKFLKEHVHNDSEVELCRHPNRNKKVCYPQHYY